MLSLHLTAPCCCMSLYSEHSIVGHAVWLFASCGAFCSETVNQVSEAPRKYTPSHTWAAVHSDSGNGAPRPGAHSASQAGPYKPPSAPTPKYQPPPPSNNPPSQYKPPNFYK